MQQTGPHSYTEAGRGPVLVCLHGIGGDDRGFVDQIAALSSNYRIIAWNMPGYRDSAAIDPIDRSIPRCVMTKVIAIAIGM